MCIVDPESGLTRAMRRFATASFEAVSAARRGADVVFLVLDAESATTRYSNRVWRWSLADDTYSHLTVPWAGHDGVARRGASLG